MTKRSLMARCCLLALYAALLAFTFVTGRTHRVYFNNYVGGPLAIDVPGKPQLKVREGGMRFLELKGSSHTFTVRFADGRVPFTGSFRIPLGIDSVVIPVSGLAAGMRVPLIKAPANVFEH